MDSPGVAPAALNAFATLSLHKQKALRDSQRIGSCVLDTATSTLYHYFNPPRDTDQRWYDLSQIKARHFSNRSAEKVLPFLQRQSFTRVSPGKRLAIPAQQESHSANITACMSAGATSLEDAPVTRGTAWVGYCRTHLQEHWGYCPCRVCQQRRTDDTDTDHPDTDLLVGPLLLIIRRRPATPDLKQLLPPNAPASPVLTAISPRPTRDAHLFSIQGRAVELSLEAGGNRFLSVQTGQDREHPLLLVAAYDIGHCAEWQTEELEFTVCAILTCMASRILPGGPSIRRRQPRTCNPCRRLTSHPQTKPQHCWH